MSLLYVLGASFKIVHVHFIQHCTEK